MPVNTEPTPKELGIFAMLLPAFSALAGVVLGRRLDSSVAAQWVWMCGAAATLVYLAVPPARRAMYVGLSRATYPIGWLVSHAVLVAVFVVVVTPIGLLLRMLGRDPLERRLERQARSYWTPREPANDVDRYFQQF